MAQHSISDRLKQLMNERNLKQVDILRLAKPYCDQFKTKIGRNDLSQYLSKNIVPRQNKLYVLAKALNVSEAWLLGFDTNRERTENEQEEAGSGDLLDKIGAVAHNPRMRRIPILGVIAAGLPIYAEENIEGYTYTDLNHGGEYFALRVKGDSMNAARINNGDVIVVRRQPEVENGEIAVVMVNDSDATVKRFQRDGDMVQLIPQSYDPAYKIQIYDLKSTSIKVIGKVKQLVIDF